MLEITPKQLLSFDNAKKARILKYIALGLVKYIPENKHKKNTKGRIENYANR